MQLQPHTLLQTRSPIHACETNTPRPLHRAFFTTPADGIDPDSSSNVLISNCTLSGGDDNVAIKSGQDAVGRAFGRPSVNITVQDVTILHGDGISIGSEMSGGAHNITIRRIRMEDVLHPLRIKWGYGRGGSVSGVLFEDIQLASLGQACGTALTVD